MLKLLKKADKKLCEELFLLFILLFMLVLRIPNLFEPYWYGDEGIYLTIGTAMRHGERLYADIIDHKTPIIYYLAMTPTQLEFRILNIIGMTITTILFYFLAKKILEKPLATYLATFFFVILTTLPWFEGNIANGELFMMCFIFIGATFFSQTKLFHQFFGMTLAHEKAHEKVGTFSKISQDTKKLMWAGFFFGLGVLTKVPALFDGFAFLAIGWFLFIPEFFKDLKKSRTLLHFQFKESRPTAQQVLFVSAGIATPILLSIIYFILRGSGKAYLDYGLLYNFHYAENWNLGFQSVILQKLFSLPGKAALLTLWMLALTFGSKWLSPRFRFLTGWFGLALFSSVLSNRPYPHYFLQTIPPLTLLLGNFVAATPEKLWKNRATKPWKHMNLIPLLEIPLTALSIFIFIQVLTLMHVGFYNTSWYYGQFWKLATHQISQTEYRNSFNSLMADNYAVAPLLQTSKTPRIFVWGTDPMLYALSQKSPTGRFTVSFHIFDFNALDETFADIQKNAPDYVIVMNDEKPFPQLNSYLNAHYIANHTYEHFTLWKRI